MGVLSKSEVGEIPTLCRNGNGRPIPRLPKSGRLIERNMVNALDARVAIPGVHVLGET